jgi:hypothetical protein
LAAFYQDNCVPDITAVIVQSIVETKQGEAFEEQNPPFHEIWVEFLSHQTVEKAEHLSIDRSVFEVFPDELVLDRRY